MRFDGYTTRTSLLSGLAFLAMILGCAAQANSPGTDQGWRLHAGATRSYLRGAAYHPGRRLIALADSGFVLTVWDGRRGRLLRRVHWNETRKVIGPIWSIQLAFDPAGQALAVGRFDGMVEVHNLSDGRRRWTAQGGLPDTTLVLPGRIRTSFIGDHLVQRLRWSGDGRTLAATDGRRIVLLDSETGRLRRPLYAFETMQQEFDDAAVRGIWDFDFLPDGEHIVSLGTDGALRTYSCRTGVQVSSMYLGDTHWYHMRVSPDGRWIALWGDPPAIQLVSLESSRSRHSIPTRRVTAFAFSPDSRYLAIGIQDSVHFVRVPFGQLVLRYGAGRGSVRNIWFDPGTNGMYTTGMLERTVRSARLLLPRSSSGTGFWDQVPMPPASPGGC